MKETTKISLRNHAMSDQAKQDNTVSKSRSNGVLCVSMTLEEALSFADEWSKNMTFHKGNNGWRVVCAVLAKTVRDQRKNEFICGKCGLRQNSNKEKPEF